MSEERWNGHQHRFVLNDASITAIGDEFGALHESGLTLEISDGRLPVWYGGDPDLNEEPNCRLEYKCYIERKGAKSDDWNGTEAQIVVKGVHQNGVPLEIRGEGWIGRTEHDDLEIVFDDPPRMILPYDWEEDDQEGPDENPVDKLKATLAEKLNAEPETRH